MIDKKMESKIKYIEFQKEEYKIYTHILYLNFNKKKNIKVLINSLQFLIKNKNNTRIGIIHNSNIINNKFIFNLLDLINNYLLNYSFLCFFFYFLIKKKKDNENDYKNFENNLLNLYNNFDNLFNIKINNNNNNNIFNLDIFKLYSNNDLIINNGEIIFLNNDNLLNFNFNLIRNIQFNR
jgi:hypothetical protein